MNNALRRQKGSSIVIVILIFTLLTSIAILSVSTTNSSTKLSGKMADRVRDYYDTQSYCSASVNILSELLNPSNSKYCNPFLENFDLELIQVFDRSLQEHGVRAVDMSVSTGGNSDSSAASRGDSKVVKYRVVNGQISTTVEALIRFEQGSEGTKGYTLDILSLYENPIEFEYEEIKFSDIKVEE